MKTVELSERVLNELVGAVEEAREEAVSHFDRSGNWCNGLEPATERRLDLALDDVKNEIAGGGAVGEGADPHPRRVAPPARPDAEHLRVVRPICCRQQADHGPRSRQTQRSDPDRDACLLLLASPERRGRSHCRADQETGGVR